MKKREFHIVPYLIWATIYMVVLVLCPHALCANPIVVNEVKDSHHIGRNFEFLADPQKSLTITDICNPKLTWQPSTKSSINLGFTSWVYWFKFTVKNTSTQHRKWYLEISYPLLDNIQLYIPHADIYELKRAGDHYPFYEREVIDPNFVFHLTEPPGQRTYYLSIETSSSLNFLPIMWTPDAFMNRLQTEFPVFWLYYGAMIVMCIYNLFIYFTIRERSHIYYVAAITCWVFCQLTLNGFAFQYLWPNSIWWANKSTPFFLMTVVISMTLFFRSYLDLAHQLKRLDDIIVYSLIWPSIVWAVFCLIGDYAICIKVATVFGLYTATALYMCSFVSYINGFKPARVFIIAFSFFVFGVILYIMKTFGLLPSNFVTRFSIQIGSTFVVVLLSFGLAEKINLIKKELSTLNANLIVTNKNLEIFKKFAEASGQGLGMSDLKGALTYLNPSYCRILEIEKAEDILQQNISQFYPIEFQRQLVTVIHDQVWRKGEWIGEMHLLSTRGNLVPVIQSFFLIRDNQGLPMYYATVVTDITGAKRAEKEIHQLNEELEQRVKQRTGQLKDANTALEESLTTIKSAHKQLVQSEKMAALGGLVAGVAHEINTPLGAGITAASLLEDKTRTFNDSFKIGGIKRSALEKYLEVASEASTIIQNNLNRAAELVRSFKQVAVDQSSEVRRRFNLYEYINQILFSLKPKLKRTQHMIHVECPNDLEINSYPGVFSQILTNLIMNSLIHGFEDLEAGTIHITVIPDDHTLTLTYSDNGKGMDHKTLKKIYDPFFTTKRSHGGTGLGMHVSYNLVTQSLNGQMLCESQPGEGVSFTIKVPLT